MIRQGSVRRAIIVPTVLGLALPLALLLGVGRGFTLTAASLKDVHESVEPAMGARRGHEAGTRTDEVMTSFKAVSGLVGEIAIATREQSSGIEQVTQAVPQKDEVTEQNAALVEQAAAESVERQARAPASAVTMFRLEAARLGSSAALRSLPSNVIAQPPRKVRTGAAPAGPKRLEADRAVVAETDYRWEAL